MKRAPKRKMGEVLVCKIWKNIVNDQDSKDLYLLMRIWMTSSCLRQPSLPPEGFYPRPMPRLRMHLGVTTHLEDFVAYRTSSNVPAQY